MTVSSTVLKLFFLCNFSLTIIKKKVEVFIVYPSLPTPKKKKKIVLSEIYKITHDGNNCVSSNVRHVCKDSMTVSTLLTNFPDNSRMEVSGHGQYVFL